MKLARRIDLALFLSMTAIGAFAACGGGNSASGGSSAGGSTGGSQGGGGSGQGAGGSGGGLFANGGMGGDTGTTSTTSSTTTTTDTSGPCQSPTPSVATTLLAKKAGADDVQSVLGVDTDAQGNIVVAGAFLGSIDFGGGALSSQGGNDAYVAKLNGNGVAQWSKRFGDGANQYAQHIATDPTGNVLVTGHYRGSINFGGGALTDTSNFFEDLFIAKLDANGAYVWAKTYGDINNEESQSIATDKDGNVLFAGAFQKTINFGGGAIVAEDGGFNAFVAKLGPTGNQIWAKSLGDTIDEQKALGVTSDVAGNVYVVGYFKGAISFDGAAQITADAGKQQGYVVKYSPTGAYLWAKTWQSTEIAAVDVAVDLSSNVFILGNFKGSASFGGVTYDAGAANDLFVVKLDSSGTHLWSHGFGEKNKAEEATSLSVDADGRPVILGTFTSTLNFGGDTLTSQGGFDIFMAKLDEKGCHMHSNAYGGPMLQRAETLSLDNTGNIVFGGSFDASVDFGTGALTATATDAYLVKTKP